MIFNLLIILGPIVAVVVALWKGWDWGDKLLRAFMFSSTTFLAVLFLAISLGFALPRDIQHTQREIVSLQDGSGAEGRFFLVSGYIDDVQKYSYYVKDGDAVQLESTDADNVRVFQNSDKPFIFQESGCTSSFEWLVECLYNESVVTEIHVPAGTVKNDYTLDAR